MTDEYKCVEVGVPDCKEEYKTVYDETCTIKFEFDCNTPPINNGYGNNNVLKTLHKVKRYKLHPGMPAPAYQNSRLNYKPENINKWIDDFQCIRTPDRQCKKTKRVVKIQKCTQSSRQECKKLRNRNPSSRKTTPKSTISKRGATSRRISPVINGHWTQE